MRIVVQAIQFEAYTQYQTTPPLHNKRLILTSISKKPEQTSKKHYLPIIYLSLKLIDSMLYHIFRRPGNGNSYQPDILNGKLPNVFKR